MKITRVINVAALMLGVLLLCQCTKEEKSAVQPQANVPATVKMAYIDSDSLAAKYNFAKDIFEANQRAQNKLENVRQQKAAELQRFQSEIEQKGRNNGYLTEESYKADMQTEVLRYAEGDAEFGAKCYLTYIPIYGSGDDYCGDSTFIIGLCSDGRYRILAVTS